MISVKLKNNIVLPEIILPSPGRKQVLTTESGPIGPPRNWGSDSGPIAKKICSLRAKSVAKRGFS